VMVAVVMRYQEKYTKLILYQVYFLGFYEL